ncbi:hypothetical protein [Leifsonia sp. 2MCAF36]|uniref:hypothetical protein n=1 Tax=Leifsonia sp. 2MCAF36 TaxID=3232988 RepID=UPI003F989BB4
MKARMRIAGIVMAAVMAVGVIVAVGTEKAPSAYAANAADFQAGFLVSDQNFYDGGAMSASDVQSFLLSQNSTCHSSYACLYGYGQSTPNMAGDAYCSPMGGMGSELASSIIARVGAACGISQKALIVLLQKEQGLVTSSSPTQGMFLHATGFSCPDTAPCDPNYAGFFYQMYYGARQFKIYKAHPTWYNYQPNAWNNILYNPNSACGSGSVYIQGYATAGLYNYTPYQPNAAAMANLYGTGDSCSAYGNRNFWRLWTDWFGSPTQTANLIRLSGTPNVYLASGNVRYAFPSTDMLAQYSALGAVADLTQAQFNGYMDGGVYVQRVLRATDGAVYFIDQGKRYRFRDCNQVYNFGYVCPQFPTISTAQANLFTDGGWLNDLIKLPDGSIWFMQSGARRQTPDPSVLAPYGVSTNTTSLSNFSIGGAQIGSPVVGAGVFTDGQGNFAASTYGGMYSLSPAAAAGTLAGKATPLQNYSFQRLYPTGQLPLRLASSGRYFVSVDGGWLEVDGPTFGGSSYFTSLGANSWTGVPLVATVTSSLFMKERSSTQIYLISGGAKQPVADQATLNWISQTYGVPSTVWTTTDGALRGLNPPAGTIVSVTGTQTVYLIDGGKRYQFRDCTQVAAWGKTCGQLPTTTADAVSEYPSAGTLTDLVKLPDGTIWLMQGGKRRETPDPSVLAQYFIPSTTTSLTNGAVAAIPVGVPVTRAGVYTDGSSFVAATQGGNFLVSAAAAAGKVGGSAVRLQAASLQNMSASTTLPLRLTSDGRYFVSVDEGWLEVAAGTFGGASAFTALGTKSWTGVPLAATTSTPVFVRERSSSQIYLVSGGYKQPIADQSSVAWVASYYGLSSRVWIGSDGVLAGLIG